MLSKIANEVEKYTARGTKREIFPVETMTDEGFFSSLWDKTVAVSGFYHQSLAPSHLLTIHPSGGVDLECVREYSCSGSRGEAKSLFIKGSQVFLSAMGACPLSSGTIPSLRQLL